MAEILVAAVRAGRRQRPGRDRAPPPGAGRERPAPPACRASAIHMAGRKGTDLGGRALSNRAQRTAPVSRRLPPALPGRDVAASLPLFLDAFIAALARAGGLRCGRCLD